MSAMLRATIAEARIRVAAATLQIAIRHAHWRTQPRVPAGNPDGGQWGHGDGGASENIWTGDDVGTLMLAGDITGFRKHGLNQAITRRVGPAAILDAIRNPIDIVRRPNGTIRYVGRDAVVVLNPAGEVVTVWGQ